MIKGTVKHKRPKLTPCQKALKKAIVPLARELKAAIRGDMPKQTGALRFAVDYKIVSKAGVAKAVIGVRSRYSRTVRGQFKVPNLYAAKAEARVGAIAKHVNATAVDRLRDAVFDLISEVIG